MEAIYAVCRDRLHKKCLGVQLVYRPSHVNGNLRNRCPHCRGHLIEISQTEIRELREAQNRLQDDKENSK